MTTLEKELNKLEPFDILDITDRIDDYIVPIEIAAKMKSISIAAIYDAIKRGKLTMVRGIPLSCLKGYTVNERNRTSGKISQLKKLEAKIKELEKASGSSDNKGDKNQSAL